MLTPPGNTHWGPAIPDLPTRKRATCLSKSLQEEGLPGPLPRACRAGLQGLRGFQELQRDLARPGARLSSQTASNSTIALIRRLESTSNLIEQRDGYFKRERIKRTASQSLEILLKGSYLQQTSLSLGVPLKNLQGLTQALPEPALRCQKKLSRFPAPKVDNGQPAARMSL